MEEKQQHLFSLLRDMGRVIVAYSGGTDSAYLAWAGTQVLGDDSLAITADSASIPESHKRDAIDFARQFGIRHELIPTHEFENPDYLKNDSNRCFHCKDELFDRLEEVGKERGIEHIVYGVNMDDLGDYRPGQNAARIHQVRAPLVEAGLSKAEIRELSRVAGLPTWDRPAAACLSSRIPYGTPVTIENIKKVETGEEELKALGFRQFRVRFHVENPQDQAKLRAQGASVQADFKILQIVIDQRKQTTDPVDACTAQHLGDAGVTNKYLCALRSDRLEKAIVRIPLDYQYSFASS